VDAVLGMTEWVADDDLQGEEGDNYYQEEVVGIDEMEVVGDMLVEEVGDCRCYSMVDELVEAVLE
jgi:hypothetical protein